MGQKNKRKAPDLAALRRAIREKQAGLNRSIKQPVSDDDNSVLVMHSSHDLPLVSNKRSGTVPSNFKHFSREQWRKLIDTIAQMFPASIRPSMYVSNCSVDEIYQSGIIVGTISVERNPYQVYLRIPKKSGDIPAGCSCTASDGEYPCPHSLYFVKHVAKLLTDPSSPISNKIERQDLLPGEPDPSRFSHQLSSLQDFVKSIERNATYTRDPSTIAESSRETKARVCWLFCEYDRRLSVRLQKQSLSKRGDKWNKPTAVRPLDLASPSVEKTREDGIILNDHFDFGATSLNFVSACRIASILIGKDNAYFLDAQVQIVPYSPCLEIIQDSKTAAGRCGFQIVAPKDARVYNFGGGIAYYLQESEVLGAAVCNNNDCAAMSRVLAECTLPAKFYRTLVEKAKELQLHVSILLPTEIGGAIRPLPVKPVIILRLQKDGKLDYALRIRDDLGVLRYPCTGPMVIPGTNNGEPIQWQRDGVAEYELIQSTCSRLGIPFSREDGSIDDFEQAVNLLNCAESAEPAIEVLWDKDSTDSIKLLGSIQAQNVRVKIEKKRDWFSLEGTCQVGSTTLEISQMLRALRAVSASDIRGNFVRLGEHGWAKISKEMRRNLQELDDSLNWERKQLRLDTTSAIGIRELQSHFSIDAAKGWKECVDKLEQAERLEPTLPAGVQAELREYQLDGFRWLRRLAEWGVGGILADDMGLGKTLQTLCVLLDRADRGPSLVIAPTSVGTNWLREANKFAPSLRAHLYRESDRSTFLENLGPMDLVICTYGLALRDVEQISKVHWSHLVLDEAQAIKNGRTKTSQAIDQIPADWKLALTGTPVENHLGELWSLFKVVAPGVFGGWDQFRDRFASPIERNHDPERMESLRKKLTPFVLRRTKSEVLTDLPPRTETNLYVELSDAEKQLYESVRQSAIGEIDALAKLPDIADQRFKLLALLTRLRQVACNPKLLHPSWEGGSAKLDQLMEKLQELKQEGHRTLIFSQFVQHLGLIKERLESEQIEYQYLDGSTTPAKRQEAVDRFQSGDATAFLISLKAGGTGLNLTAADYVIHMDPWWNPAVEDQATDRAHRIGQSKPVFVYRIIAQGTIEEEILKLHDSKRDLVAGILEGSHSAASVSTEDLIAMIRG